MKWTLADVQYEHVSLISAKRFEKHVAYGIFDSLVWQTDSQTEDAIHPYALMLNKQYNNDSLIYFISPK